MIRRGIGRPMRRGLVGTMARTAVVAGTATAVSGNVARRQQAKAVQAQEAQAYQAQQQQAAMEAAAQQAVAQQTAAQPAAYAPPAPAPAAAAPAGGADVIAQLTQLGQLRDSGVLTEAEFEAQKARILGG